MTNTAYPRRRRSLRAAAVAAAVLALVAGCERTPARDYAAEGAAWKSKIAEAYERNDALNNYRFDGSIAFGADDATSAGETAPAAFLPMLRDGLSWSGVLYREPLRLEADVRVGPDGAAPARTIPLLAQDGTLYVSVPAVNAEGEYFAVALDKADDGPLPVSPLLTAAGAFDDLAEHVIARVDPEWIRTPDDAAPAEGGDAAADDGRAEPSRFVVEVTADNAEHLASAFRDGFATWAESLPPELGANALGLTGEETFRLAEGGTIALALDENGFLVDQSVELAIERGAGAEADANLENAVPSEKFSYAVRLSEPNGAPDMTRSVPNDVIPFENVLAFLAAGAGAPKP